MHNQAPLCALSFYAFCSASSAAIVQVLEELLVKLEIEHVTWTTSKKGYFHHVVFPLQAGAPCETTLHCLTELGIGTKLNSSVR